MSARRPRIDFTVKGLMANSLSPAESSGMPTSFAGDLTHVARAGS